MPSGVALSGGGKTSRSWKSMLRRGEPLQPGQVRIGMAGGAAAHLLAGPEPRADRRPIRLSEDPAAVVVGELHAAHARRLALGHAGDRGGDRERDAAGGAAGAAIHGPSILACYPGVDDPQAAAGIASPALGVRRLR